MAASCKSNDTPITAKNTADNEEEFNDVEREAFEDVDRFLLADSITKVAFSELSGKLKSVIDTGGFAAAIDFCSIEALPLTERIGDKYGVTLERISEKCRNPENKANNADIKVLARFSENTSPILDQNQYYAPIYTQGLCLNCHGTVGAELKEELHTKIAAKYPKDLAVDYKEGELRGAWKVTFKK